MKTLIVVPAFNEEVTIVSVIKDLRSHGYRDILVVDDGSTDLTSLKTQEMPIKVVRHLINRGLGAALGTGFDYARKSGTDILVTFDSDGQHRARDVAKLIKPIQSRKADVVIGSRMLANSKEMPLDRRILNICSNLATFFLYGFMATDSLSGLRAFNRGALEKIRIKTDKMEISNEFLKEIKRNKLRYEEVPIKPIYTEYSRESGQRNSNSIAIGIKMIIRTFR